MAIMLSRCPVCEGEFKITGLTCEQCDIRVQGAFDRCRFCSLPAEHLAFVEVFLKCEGNISRVEKELSVSYPTVRNRLSGALSALGLSADGQVPPTPVAEAFAEETPEESSERRRNALNALARGEISAEDAAKVLRDLS